VNVKKIVKRIILVKMKTISNNPENTKFNGIETLSLSEMHNIRGGSDNKLRTKDIDVYDTREE
jgi:hypothetical protein